MKKGVVLDASVVLNLLGSGHAVRVLAAIPGRKLVVEGVSAEILRHPIGNLEGDHLTPLVRAGVLEKIALPDGARDRFLDLVGADPPDGLDDGEAATLAAADALHLAAAIDERKGRRIAEAQIPKVTLVSSASIFAMTEVRAALGSDLVDAVFSACLHARMRVLPEHDAWVRKLLGPERAGQCPSLKKLRR